MKNKQKSISIAAIVAGLFVCSAGYTVFLNPHSISVGGLTGVCVLLNKYLGLPYTTTLLILNGVLFVWGIRVKGIPYVLRSLTAMILLGILLDMPLPALSSMAPPSISASMVCGSVLTGVGYGLIVAADTSTGGSDLFAMIVVKKVPGTTVGMVMNGVDLIVVLASGVLEGAQTVPFSLAAMLLCNTMIDITAYAFGQADLPKWIKRLKHTGQAINSYPTMGWKMFPYAVGMLTCIILLFTRTIVMDRFPWQITPI